MTALSEAITALFQFLSRHGQVPPTHDVCIVEVGSRGEIDARGRLRVKRIDYREPATYERRFAELLEAGLPWINLSCYGADGEKLLVVVEFPEESRQKATRTSLNYSGPSKLVCDHGWNANEALAIE